MKVRLQPQQIRFRLSPAEVERLSQAGGLREELLLGGARLGYALAVDRGASGVEASFDGRQISIVIPSETVATWAASGQETIRAAHGTLEILVEKDRGSRGPGRG
jgi:hypothetical protein